MQHLSAAQKEHLYDGNTIGVLITGETVDGDPIQITQDDLIASSFTIERNWATGQSIEIGCADAAELVFDLYDEERKWSALRWEGARLTVKFDIGGELLQAGIFTVDEPPRRLSTLRIRALDDMARFNRPYSPGITAPASLRQILVDACAQCGVTLYTLEFTNDDYVVDELPDSEGANFHQVVSWVAELAGCNAWIDEYARLRLSWYGENQGSAELEIGPNERFTYELAERDIEITGIVFKGADGDYLIGEDTYALVIDGNPLLQSGKETVLSTLFDKVGGFTYRPYKFEVLPYPHIWPGDMVTKLVDKEENELQSMQSIVTNHTYKLNGKSALEGRGETETVRGYATGAPFTAAQKRVLQSVAKVEVGRQTSGLEQATLHLNELMANALGLYSTVIEQPSGAKLYYMHDKPTLEESMVIWHWTELGLAWTDQGWNDGNPVWQYGVLADGNAVLKVLTALGINADWINAGRVKAEHVQIGPETDYYPGQRYTWQQYQGKTWQEAIENV